MSITQEMQDFLSKLNKINDIENRACPVNFDIKSINYDKENKTFSLYSGTGYNDAHCDAENSYRYTIKSVDFLPVIKKLMENNNATINCNVLKEKKNNSDSWEYAYHETEIDEKVSLGRVRGLIYLDENLIIKLDKLTFEDEGSSFSSDFYENKKYIDAGKLFLHRLLYDDRVF